MKIAHLCGLLAVIVLMGASAFAANAVPDVNAALAQWKEAVEGGSAENIVKLYDKDAIMISTFVQAPITTRGALLGYYKKVVSNEDVKVELQATHPRVFGNNVAVNTGLYTLSYTQEGEDVVIPARFSFTYVLRDGKWMIVDQHSSRVPLPDEVK